MPDRVFLAGDAAGDLEGLYEYVFAHDGPEKANYVLERIEAALESLTENPHRGVWPKELLDLGIREYRENFSSHTGLFIGLSTTRSTSC